MRVGRQAAAIASFAALAFTSTPACEPLFEPHAPGAHAPSGEAGVAGDALALCQAKSARVARCNPSRTPELAGACDSVRDTHSLRADWVQAELACLANRACNVSADTDDSDCEMIGYRAIGVSSPDWPPVVRRCVQMGDICGGSFATCRRLTAMTDDARSAALGCFSAPSCDQYAACLHAFFANRLDPAVPTW